MELVLLLIVAALLVQNLPSHSWREFTLTDTQFTKHQELLSGTKRKH